MWHCRLCRSLHNPQFSSLLPQPPPLAGSEIPFVLSPPLSYGAELGTKVALTCGVRGEGVTGVSWEARSGRTFPATTPGKPLILNNIELGDGDEYRCVVQTQEGSQAVSNYARVSIYGEWRWIEHVCTSSMSAGPLLAQRSVVTAVCCCTLKTCKLHPLRYCVCVPLRNRGVFDKE